LKEVETQAESFEVIACPICGSGEYASFSAGTRHLNLEVPLGVVRCKSCGLLFLNPRPSPYARQEIWAGRRPAGLEIYLDNLANYGAVTKSQIPLFQKRVEELRARFFPSGGVKVLDIGASSGEFLEAARSVNWDTYGVEPSVDGVEKARAKLLNVVQAPAESLPFEDNTFDLVHSNHVFEHLSDPLAAARESWRVLKPGGIVFIEVPNQFDNIQFFRYRIMGKIPIRARNVRSIHHLVFFSRNFLRRLLAEAGFKDIVVLNRYGAMRTGWQRLGSIIVRTVGKLYLGAPIIQAIAVKR
jgi:SAM-dependent methyltransferase